MKTTKCYVCHADIPDIEGPVSPKKYMPQSPGCWKYFSEVLAKEYGEWQYPGIHRLTVDCYAAQHPTSTPDRQAAQSVTVHLTGIYLALKKQMPPKEITEYMGHVIRHYKNEFTWFPPPDNLGDITITDVWKAKDLEEHVGLVHQWAESVWNAWVSRHEYIIEIVGMKIRN